MQTNPYYDFKERYKREPTANELLEFIVFKKIKKEK